MDNSGSHHKLKVSHLQGYMKASISQLFINDQGHLCPTHDGINFNNEQLVILRRFLPLLWDDFCTVASCTLQMTEHKKDTLSREKGLVLPPSPAPAMPKLKRKKTMAIGLQQHT